MHDDRAGAAFCQYGRNDNLSDRAIADATAAGGGENDAVIAAHLSQRPARFETGEEVEQIRRLP
jgi:hypothetical protein